MRFSACHGSATSRKAQRPWPPQLLTAGTDRSVAVATFARFFFLRSPVTSRTSVSRSFGPSPAPSRGRIRESGTSWHAGVYGIPDARADSRFARLPRARQDGG